MSIVSTSSFGDASVTARYVIALTSIESTTNVGMHLLGGGTQIIEALSMINTSTFGAPLIALERPNFVPAARVVIARKPI